MEGKSENIYWRSLFSLAIPENDDTARHGAPPPAQCRDRALKIHRQHQSADDGGAGKGNCSAVGTAPYPVGDEKGWE